MKEVKVVSNMEGGKIMEEYMVDLDIKDKEWDSNTTIEEVKNKASKIADIGKVKYEILSLNNGESWPKVRFIGNSNKIINLVNWYKFAFRFRKNINIIEIV